MKVRRAFLALLLSVSCAFSGSFAVSAQAVESEPATLEEGLKGYWDFEGEDPMENKGSDASLSGKLSGNAVSVRQSSAEEMGSVLHFDTRSGESSRMLIASALNSGGEDFSISLWVNHSSQQNASAKTILLQQSGSGRTLLYRQNGQYVTYISAADVAMGTSTGSDIWEHLVLVRSGEPSSYQLTLYVNGEKANERNLTAGAVNAVTDLIIGAHKNAGDTGQFVGDIDELRLYDRAVTAEEAEALYAEHESLVLEQQLQGIRKDLEALIAEAREVYENGSIDKEDPAAAALAAAISGAELSLEGTDADAILSASEALENALNAYMDESLVLTVDTENVSRTVGDGIFGINHRYAFNGYGSFDSETMQIKEEFAELYSQAGFGSLRYPGGTISNLFNWKDTIGPKEGRVAQIHGFYNNSGQHGIAPNFGIDEAAEFVQDYDSELVYVYALARGDADDAADLIEYLNAEVGSNPNGGTAWAEVRATNGHEEPYNVRYFEIGNEMNQGGGDGTTAQTYWIDDVPGGALEGYVNGGTASFTKQYAVARDDWNQSASYSDGSADQSFYLRYARVERDENADDYESFTAVKQGSVKVYVGGEAWTETDDLSGAGAADKVFAVDYKTGAISFGDGEHGAVPASGKQITADYSVDRDGFVQISEAMRNTMDQINEYNAQNGLAEKEIHIYSSYETENFVQKMHNEGHDDLYDGLTIHPYSGTPSGGSSTEESRETFYYDAMRKGDAKAADVENYVKLMQQYDETKVPVISEYGIFRSTDAMVRSQTHALYIARAIMEYVRLGSPYIQKHCLVDWYSEGADSLGPTQQAVIQAVSAGGSTADGEGELATVFTDVYASEFGTTFPLEGKPLSIDAQHNYGIGSWNYTMGIMAPSPIAVLHIMTDSDLQLVIPSTLETTYNGRQMLLGADTGQPLALETYAYGNYGEVAVAQGKTWHSLIDGYAVYYTVRNPEGEQLESKQWAEYGSNWVTFDEKKHRFLSYVYNSSDGMMTSYTSTRPMRAYGRAWSDAIPKTASVPQSGEPSLTDVFDADGPELASIEVLDFVSTGTWAYAIATGGTSPLTLYEFSSSAAEPTCSGLYELSLPNGAQAADCHFAASWGFGHILFMATGNKVYKIDLNRNNPAVSLIYEYTDDAAATAVALKFKDMDNSTYFHDLGVAFNRADGTGTVVELRLTQAGDVNREEGSTFEYTGFGTIVDLAFNHAE